MERRISSRSASCSLLSPGSPRTARLGRRLRTWLTSSGWPPVHKASVRRCGSCRNTSRGSCSRQALRSCRSRRRRHRRRSVAKLGRILVVDDQLGEIGDVVAHLESRFDVLLTRSLSEARASLSRRPDAILLDVRLQAADSAITEGLSFLAEVRRELPFLPVVMYSGYAGVAMAVDAMKAGASDFLQKTAASPGEVARTLRRAIQQAKLERRVQRLESELARHAGTEIIGTDPKIEDVRRLIRLVAEDGRSSVLIRGETGTGKELVARAIHGSGARCGAPLVAVSLVSLNRETISSDLFGHEKGAFTGAGERRIGLIEEADGGVLFLDEIGEVPLDLQAKLLRFLDDHQVMRLGSSAPIAVDLQLVAATNAPLEEL